MHAFAEIYEQVHITPIHSTHIHLNALIHMHTLAHARSPNSHTTTCHACMHAAHCPVGAVASLMNFTEELVLVAVGVLILVGLMGVERWERLRQHRVKYVLHALMLR
jgi:hypothetical protein